MKLQLQKHIAGIVLGVFVFLISVLLLASAIKGDRGNPIAFQQEKDLRVTGPFEASNTTARYALTEAIVEAHTFFLSEEQAKFAAPDVVDYKGKFISIFTPGVSFIAVPFYALGKYIGAPQLVTFLTIFLFAMLNVFLIARLASKFGVHDRIGIVCGFLFLFGTNALVYSQTLSQHHISTTLILLALLNAFRERRTVWSNLIFGALIGVAALVDIPNLILMMPIGVYIMLRHISSQETGEKFRFTIKLNIIGILLGLMPFVSLFAWYNYVTTGSYTKLAQSIGRTKFFRDNLSPERSAELTDEKDSGAAQQSGVRSGLSLPFSTRRELNGFYTLLISDERSWIYYSPVVFLGIVGFFFLYRERSLRSRVVVLINILIVNIVLYSLFPDPWGGWAFGPRYLIPSAAILCAAIGFVLQEYMINFIFMALFSALSIYSIWVNVIGVTTTSMIPPRIEAVNLPDPIPANYTYNLQFVEKNISSSLLYNRFLSPNITVVKFVRIYTSTIVGVLFALSVLAALTRRKKESV